MLYSGSYSQLLRKIWLDLSRDHVIVLRCSASPAGQFRANRLLEIPDLQLQGPQVTPKADLRFGERGNQMEPSLVRGR